MPNANQKILTAMRWIDERLRALVLHAKPLANAVDEGMNEYPAIGFAGDELRAFRRDREANWHWLRSREIDEANALVELWRECAESDDGTAPSVPADVIRAIAALQCERDSHLATVAAECDLVGANAELAIEGQRARYDGADERGAP